MGTPGFDTHPPQPSRRLHWQGWILLAILAVALLLRLASIDFGLPGLNDPDELMFEMGALRMLRGPTLNPGWFGHPATTTMYVLALVDIGAFGIAWLLGRATSVAAFGALIYANPGWLILPGRIVMTLFGMATIILTWRLARRFFGPWAGLAAAALLAVDPVHVTYSQIIRSDMMACFFMLLCLDAAAIIAERGDRRAFLRSALWLGLAVATKWPFALSGLAIMAATAVAIFRGVIDWRQGLARMTGAGFTAIGVLILASPFLLLDYHTVVRNLYGESQAHHLGATSQGIWWNVHWYASGPILKGMGWFGLILTGIGVWRLPAYRTALAVIAPVAIGFMLLLSTQHLVWERWAMPLMPLGAIVAGLGMLETARLLQRWEIKRYTPWISAMVVIAAVMPLLFQVLIDSRMRATDTRQLASAWARAHIAPGSTVLVEHFAFDLLQEPWRFLFPMGDAGCVDVRAVLRGKVSYKTIERARADRSNIDYGTVAPAMRKSCHADFAILTQYDRYRLERNQFPREFFQYLHLMKSGITAKVIYPLPGKIGGPIVIILSIHKS